MPATQYSMRFEEIFDQQGTPEEFRGPEHYFFHEVTAEDSREHAGEVYAIPRQVFVRGNAPGLYYHQENGALIEETADVDSSAVVGERSMVLRQAILGERSEVGAQALVGAAAQLGAVRVGEGVEIADGAIIDMAEIGDGSKIGRVKVNATEGVSIIGSRVTLEDGVNLRGGNRIGNRSILRSYSWMGRLAELGPEVELGERARVFDRAQVGGGSYVMPRQTVGEGRRVRPDTLVCSTRFKHVRKSADRNTEL